MAKSGLSSPEIIVVIVDAVCIVFVFFDNIQVAFFFLVRGIHIQTQSSEYAHSPKQK